MGQTHQRRSQHNQSQTSCYAEALFPKKPVEWPSRKVLADTWTYLPYKTGGLIKTPLRLNVILLTGQAFSDYPVGSRHLDHAACSASSLKVLRCLLNLRVIESVSVAILATSLDNHGVIHAFTASLPQEKGPWL